MAQRVDPNRGYTLKQCDKATCIPVYMYKDDPGVYLNVFGDPVPDEVAKEAGFDVVELGKKRLMRQRMADAMEQIRLEIEMAPENDKVVEERDGLQIVTFGNAYHIKDKDGNVISPIPLPLADAKLLLGKLAPEKPKPAPAREKARKEADKE